MARLSTPSVHGVTSIKATALASPGFYNVLELTFDPDITISIFFPNDSTTAARYAEAITAVNALIEVNALVESED